MRGCTLHQGQHVAASRSPPVTLRTCPTRCLFHLDLETVCANVRCQSNGAVQGKDVFEAFYKKDFAKRLLMERSVSADVEHAMIAKLRGECGAQYTSKLEGMIKDEALSKEVAAAFRASPQATDAAAQPGCGVDMHVRVLTSGFWPSYPVIEANLPPVIRRCAVMSECRAFFAPAASGTRPTMVGRVPTFFQSAAFW